MKQKIEGGKEIKNYKGISLRYCEQDGMIAFNFEGERKTKYVFEAERIIDEPVWESCEVEGYFLDGYIDKFIGLAKATRRNIKTGRPDWVFKGEYDMDYKRPMNYDERKVFEKNQENNEVYRQWKEQRDVYLGELRKLNSITTKLL